MNNSYMLTPQYINKYLVKKLHDFSNAEKMAAKAAMFRVSCSSDWSARTRLPPCAQPHGQKQRLTVVIGLLKEWPVFSSKVFYSGRCTWRKAQRDSVLSSGNRAQHTLLSRTDSQRHLPLSLPLLSAFYLVLANESLNR